MKSWHGRVALVSALLGATAFAVEALITWRIATYALKHEVNMRLVSVGWFAGCALAGLIITWFRPRGFLGASAGVLGFLLVLQQRVNGLSVDGWRSALMFSGAVAVGECIARFGSSLRAKRSRAIGAA